MKINNKHLMLNFFFKKNLKSKYNSERFFNVTNFINGEISFNS